MYTKTNTQLRQKAEICKNVFVNKNKDYGTSWRILRISTFIDQIFIKATRIRNIEENKIRKIDDDIQTEYIGIINYSVLTLIQIELEKSGNNSTDFESILKKYEFYIQEAFSLQAQKNHDYGEAWRDMYISSFTDLILTKILRIKSIIDNEGKTIASEGIDANLFDMINYSFFALIKLEE